MNRREWGERMAAVAASGADDGDDDGVERPAWEGDFMRAAASHIMSVGGQMTSLLQQDHASGAESGRGAFAAFIAPMEVTSRVRARIAALPVASRGPIWMVYTDVDETYEGTGLTCTVHQVGKERGSNGKILGESDGLGVSLAMCGIMDASRSMTSRPPLLLGTIAKACLQPGGMMMMPGAASVLDVRPSRPRKVLFQTRGELEMLVSDLKDMGILEVDVAEAALVRSLELYKSAQNNTNVSAEDHELMFTGDMSDPETLGRLASRRLQAGHQGMFEPYVSEERVPLGTWTPPSEPGDLPGEWYARPPDDANNWRPTELLGWRTNLERAVLREDVDKVKEIVAAHDPTEVREYVECRLLLTKMAQRGLVEACKALLDHCGASVEGVQAPDSEPWWLAVQDESGNCDSLTPLHQASRNGMAESVRLLLKYGADVNRIDKAEIRGSALHHAVSMGQVDCVRLLCENGADLTYEGMGGDALDISELCAGGDAARKQVQEKVQQILREFDRRCSYCRDPNPGKKCPCGKERYCDIECQRGRWKKHKKYHKSLADDNKKK